MSKLSTNCSSRRLGVRRQVCKDPRVRGLGRRSQLHRDILSKILCFSERQFLNRQRKLSASAAPGAQALPEPDAVERGTPGGAFAVPRVMKNTLVAQDNTEMFAAESKYLELL